MIYQWLQWWISDYSDESVMVVTWRISDGTNQGGLAFQMSLELEKEFRSHIKSLRLRKTIRPSQINSLKRTNIKVSKRPLLLPLLPLEKVGASRINLVKVLGMWVISELFRNIYFSNRTIQYFNLFIVSTEWDFARRIGYL